MNRPTAVNVAIITGGIHLMPAPVGKNIKQRLCPWVCIVMMNAKAQNTEIFQSILKKCFKMCFEVRSCSIRTKGFLNHF